MLYWTSDPSEPGVVLSSCPSTSAFATPAYLPNKWGGVAVLDNGAFEDADEQKFVTQKAH